MFCRSATSLAELTSSGWDISIVVFIALMQSLLLPAVRRIALFFVPALLCVSLYLLRSPFEARAGAAATMKVPSLQSAGLLLALAGSASAAPAHLAQRQASLQVYACCRRPLPKNLDLTRGAGRCHMVPSKARPAAGSTASLASPLPSLPTAPTGLQYLNPQPPTRACRMPHNMDRAVRRRLQQEICLPACQPRSSTKCWRCLSSNRRHRPRKVGWTMRFEVLGSDIAAADCLTVNVIRPAGTAANAKVPVLVYIYGGTSTLT